MQTVPPEINDILDKLKRQEASLEEISYIQNWLNAGPVTEKISLLSQYTGTAMHGDHIPQTRVLEAILNSVLSVDKSAEELADSARSGRIRFLRRWGWAAAAVLIVSACAYLFSVLPAERSSDAVVRLATSAAEILPGKEGAILTLGNGQQVVLDSAGTGIIANDNGVNIELGDGQLLYGDGSGAAQVVWNTMTTPRGRQFRLILPDGTAVWLNAASSISYPTVFNGNAREVRIMGEAYFDVASNAQKPFRVKVTDSFQIDVLGTQFNVSAYTDENSISATLVEGAVNIKANSVIRRIAPGQMFMAGRSSAAAGNSFQIINDASVDAVTAWKTGVFNFNNKSLASIMRELARWYDIEVEYTGTVPDKYFWGEMGMDLKLEDVLLFLEKSGVKFKFQGRKLIVQS